jgi:hypothetical protein
MEKGLVKS